MIRIVETTTDQVKIAEKISKSIINLKLSPCVQIIDKVRSFYIWQDEMVSEEEYVIKIKTIDEYIEKITSIIIQESNYDVPEIISYEFQIENKDYEDWFNENV